MQILPDPVLTRVLSGLIKDFGTAIAGHGGVLDRIDSLCFAGPVFVHATRYFFAL